MQIKVLGSDVGLRCSFKYWFNL